MMALIMLLNAIVSRTQAAHAALARAWRLCALASTLAACADVSGSKASSAPADTTHGGMSFRLAGANGAAIVVPAYINGRGPFELILDTGATLTCLDSSLTRELTLPVQHAVIGAGVGVAGSGRVQVVRIDSMRVGAASSKGLNACAMNLSNLRIVGANVRGLLGLNFLRNFRMTLDFDRHTLHLTEPAVASTRASQTHNAR
jgi:predicted aspartyl protease